MLFNYQNAREREREGGKAKENVLEPSVPEDRTVGASEGRLGTRGV